MKKKNKPPKPLKEPSLLRKLLTIYYEQAKRRRALRLLQKQSWSFEFLSVLLVKASKLAGQNLSLVIKDKDGKTYTLTCDKAKNSDAVDKLDDSIFNHLDDDTAINAFIANNSVR